jgi:hypothetical protein
MVDHKPVPPAGKLDVAEVKDEADVSPRTAPADTSGKRIRAIPYQNASTVRVRPMDFNLGGIKHDLVEWDFRKDNFTLPVGGDNEVISQEAADYLTKNFPTDFEYINDGKDEGKDDK